MPINEWQQEVRKPKHQSHNQHNNSTKFDEHPYLTHDIVHSAKESFQINKNYHKAFEMG